MLEYGDGHRPGFLTPYFFGINATFAITQLRGLSTTYYIGEREEHLIHKDAYPGYGDFVTACSNDDAALFCVIFPFYVFYRVRVCQDRANIKEDI